MRDEHEGKTAQTPANSDDDPLAAILNLVATKLQADQSCRTWAERLLQEEGEVLTKESVEKGQPAQSGPESD